MKTAMLNAFRASSMMYPGAPQIMFAPEDGTGTGETGAETGQENNAAADAAQKAADEAAAEAARLEKELADAEDAARAAEDEGKNAKDLAAEKAKLLREVMDKKNKLKDAEKKASDAAAALAAYDGVDPAKVRELLKKEADAEKAAAEARGDFESVKKAMAEEHAKTTKTLEERIAALETDLQSKNSMIDNLTVGNDFGSSVFIRDSLTLTPGKARQLYGTHFEVKDGQTIAYDKPAGAANRKPMVDASGNPLSFDEAFKRIIDADPDKETLLKAKVNPGSNSNTNAQRATEKKVTTTGFGVDRIRASFEKNS